MAAIDAQADAVSALVTDVHFGPNATGWDVGRHARKVNPNLPVVYLTGGHGPEWASLGVPNSVLIVKPFTSAQVLTAVSQLLNVGNTLGA